MNKSSKGIYFMRDISNYFPNTSLRECVLYVIIKVT